MMALALTALLSFQDPAGDTAGNGSLAAPTAAVFRNLSSFDLLGVDVLDAPTLQFSLAFAALPNPLGLPNGFSLPIVELYVGDDTVGSPSLLPGSGMNLPGNATWHYALRLTGDRAQVFVADGDTVTELGRPAEGATAASAAEESVAETSPVGAPEPGALELNVTDTVVTVSTALPRPESLTLYGLVGSYSPFSDNGWQALSAAPSPWAFSSSDQTVPVVDVLAEEDTAQARAIDTRTLPGLRRAAPPAAPRANPWLLLVTGGFVIALVGFVGRFTVPKPVFRTGLPPEVYEQGGADVRTDAPPNEPGSAEPALASSNEDNRETYSEPVETEPVETVPLNTEPSNTERFTTDPGPALDSQVSATLEPQSADPAAADLEAWVASETPRPEKPAAERVPELPETYPGTEPGAVKAVASLDLREEDWPEPEDADLWPEVARADERTNATNTPVDADVKHL